MEHSHDADGVRHGVNDQVGVNAPEEDVSVSQVIARVPHAWRLGELTERAIEIAKYAISGVETILGNECPNLVKIPQGMPADDKSFHPR